MIYKTLYVQNVRIRMWWIMTSDALFQILQAGVTVVCDIRSWSVVVVVVIVIVIIVVVVIVLVE